MLEVKFITETALRMIRDGKNPVELVDALRCLHAIGEITSQELEWANILLYDTKKKVMSGHGVKQGQFIAEITLDPDFIDSTILWLRGTADGAEEPFQTYIQRGAEVMHDHWSGLLTGEVPEDQGDQE